jgi:hypothetical protein
MQEKQIWETLFSRISFSACWHQQTRVTNYYFKQIRIAQQTWEGAQD